jgi:UDP-hydrolysing UDP-N-acetyl-D-glucosamine 2-epimerase
VAHILKSNKHRLNEHIFDAGVGEHFAIDKPFVLISQHPVTSEYGAGEAQITMTLQAVKELDLPAIVLWPNADAGADDIARGIRKWRECKLDRRMHFFKNLPIDVYVRLMKRTACLIGNSSSGIREGAFIGTPVVNIGTRQHARDRGSNVIDVTYDKGHIKQAILQHLEHGPYAMEPIYGDGCAGERIADILATENVDVQKCITY